LNPLTLLWVGYAGGELSTKYTHVSGASIEIQPRHVVAAFVISAAIVTPHL